ncbi:2-dehydro-3-deoxygalactonokinase [Phaeobacter sp. C3_T13_0]|uniref:2-dehydro-3-deoxygalactonokinase n=1 Tax=Phaeobacter cretensis TaxID=3342641 RepID=UPI0039BC4A79
MTAHPTSTPDKTTAMPVPAWIAADWGTSHLRLWLMDDQNKVMHRILSDRGMSSLPPADYEPTLLQLLADHLPEKGELATSPIQVVCCGMAGSRQGWAEAQYATSPCTPPGISEATKPRVLDPRLSVYLLPGVKNVAPADVMRGEETQIAGFLARDARTDTAQVICLPGTHSKWARLENGKITAFTTFMTGELFALLQRQSVLRHCVSEDGWDADTFTTAVEDAITDPVSIAAALFGVRANALLSGDGPDIGRARLSGLLIGAELAATRDYWTNQPVAILGTDTLARHYETALASQGCQPARMDAETLTIAGLCAAYDQLKKSLHP